MSHTEQMGGEMDRFSAVPKHSDEAQSALEDKNLALEARKLDAA